MSMESYPVQVYVHDMSKGLARRMSGPLLGKQIDGVWHSAVVVYGEKFHYGDGGIGSCPPSGNPVTIVDIGHTEIPKEKFKEYIDKLDGSTFKAECYHFLDHNCNTFTNEVSKFLTGKPIPSYITDQPREAMEIGGTLPNSNLPFGDMLRPFVDALSNDPFGGALIRQTVDMLSTSATVPSDTMPSGSDFEGATGPGTAEKK